jgi:hypothetical protein
VAFEIRPDSGAEKRVWCWCCSFCYSFFFLFLDPGSCECSLKCCVVSKCDWGWESTIIHHFLKIIGGFAKFPKSEGAAPSNFSKLLKYFSRLKFSENPNFR